MVALGTKIPCRNFFVITVFFVQKKQETAALNEFWNNNNLRGNKDDIEARRQMLLTCANGGKVQADGRIMLPALFKPILVMREFVLWLLSLPEQVTDNLIIVSDNPAFDIGTLNLLLSREQQLPIEKLMGGYKRVVCSSSLHKGLAHQYFDVNVWGSEEAAFVSLVPPAVANEGFDAYKQRMCKLQFKQHTPLSDAKSIAWDFWFFRRCALQ